MVGCQDADDIPAYKVQDDGGNVKVVHHNWLFLVATPRGDATSLGGSESASKEGTAWSTLVELTPLEWKSESPESKVDGTLTQCLTSYVLLGWVDGILWPLPSVAPQPTLQGLGAGDGMSSFSDEEVH